MYRHSMTALEHGRYRRNHTDDSRSATAICRAYAGLLR